MYNFKRLVLLGIDQFFAHWNNSITINIVRCCHLKLFLELAMDDYSKKCPKIQDCDRFHWRSVQLIRQCEESSSFTSLSMNHRLPWCHAFTRNAHTDWVKWILRGVIRKKKVVIDWQPDILPSNIYACFGIAPKQVVQLQNPIKI